MTARRLSSRSSCTTPGDATGAVCGFLLLAHRALEIVGQRLHEIAHRRAFAGEHMHLHRHSRRQHQLARAHHFSRRRYPACPGCSPTGRPRRAGRDRNEREGSDHGKQNEDHDGGRPCLRHCGWTRGRAVGQRRAGTWTAGPGDVRRCRGSRCTGSGADGADVRARVPRRLRRRLEARDAAGARARHAPAHPARAALPARHRRAQIRGAAAQVGAHPRRPRVVAGLLGHADIKTTFGYAHLAEDSVFDAANRVSRGLADMLDGGAVGR